MRRLTRFTLALAGALALPTARLAAQGSLTIGGRVTGSAGEPLANTSLSLVGTTLGTVTRDDGGYALIVPADRVTGQPVILRVRRIGYKDASARLTLSPGRVTQDFTLVSAPTQLEGVVVTALGIERDKRSLGVAQQTVAPEELTSAREVNIVNALSGKVAGVQTTNNGPPGGSARVVIRGANSVAGNNQPLFVIDGIPIDNTSLSSSTNANNPLITNTTAGRNSGFGGLDFGNAASDINPNDIESISVLKGANAAALYGARAANGAVVITTKSGRGSKGMGVTATQNVTFETPLRLPEFQNVYGQGSGGQFSYKDGRGGGVNDNVNRSWGPPMDGRLITQWWSNGVPAPWVPAPDNVKNFLETGRTSTSTVAVTGASERADVRLSATNLDVKSMFPSNTLRRLNTSLNGGAKITDKLSARAAVNYNRGVGHNRPGTGYDANSALFNIMIWGGRQRDLEHLSVYMNPDGTQFGPNRTTTNNPYWDVYADPNNDTRDRILGNGSVTYQVNDWLSATARSGTDWYRDWRKQEYADGNIAVDYSGGAFFEQNIYNRETNSDFLITAERKAAGPLGLTVNVGGNLRDSRYSNYNNGTNHLVIPGTFNIRNSAVTPQVSSFESTRRTNSIYGQTQFSWNNYAFVDVTGRNDWSSTLPTGNNSYFYPSISGSLVFTDALPSLQLGKWLTYGKLRASYAAVGNDADPYQLGVTYTAGTPFGSVPRFNVPQVIPNASLKPERTSSWETGGELRLLDDRLTLDATYYNKVTDNQIIPAQITPAIGFTDAVVNAGSIRNKGIELQSTISAIRSATGGFNWDVVVNYAKNDSRVESLYPGLQTVVLGAYWGLSVEARLNEPYGTLYGNPYLRDSQGRLIVQNGLPRVDPKQVVLGHYTPDWIGGIQNRFHYGDFDFSFLVDTRQGGQIFSTTKMFGEESGVLASSLMGRENGQTLAEGGGLVVDGVNADGSANTTKVTAQAYFNSLFQLHEANMVDGSFVKLREARLGYNVPSRLSGRLGITSMNVALVGRNLWLHAKAPDIDPEGAFDNGNVQGIEFVNFPSARSVGFVLNVTP